MICRSNLDRFGGNPNTFTLHQEVELVSKFCSHEESNPEAELNLCQAALLLTGTQH